ncbi:elongation factor EF-2 [Candidatus Woesearchaeota archaeon]|nr:elongation factor EF-2 [Candidatus Woesearchaeota archaeon]
MGERMVEKVMRITQTPSKIRNICTSAHIHHGKCVAPNTRLFLTDGTVITAEQLYQQATTLGTLVRDDAQETVYDLSHTNIGVFSLNKETGKLEKKVISHAWKLSGGGAINVKLRTGAQITTTPEHRYITLEDMQFAEKEAQELKLGDRIVCARKIDIDETLNLKEETLQRLAKQHCHVKLKQEYAENLKDRILRHGLKSIANLLSVKEKSFYHGIWQGRYSLAQLLKLVDLFKIESISSVYDHIKSISFRPTTKSTKEISLPLNFNELFYLAGLFFGDGSGKKFVVGKQELKDKCMNICRNLGINPIYVENQDRTPEVLTNESLTYLFKALFDYPARQKSHNIHLNDFIFRAPQNTVSQFIKAYFDCDGTVEESRRAVSVTSVSPQMLKDLQLLLLRFSCTSIISHDTLYLSGISAKQYLDNISFEVEHKIQKTQKLVARIQGNLVTDTIPLSSAQMISLRKVPMASIDHHYYKYEKQILTPTLGTALRLKQQMADLHMETTIMDRLTSGDLAFVEIIRIEQREEPIVYDFSIPDNKNFIAEGMVIHNTAFTDNLLAAAGMMSSKAAGDLEEGMATWQHKDEQERLMTVDAANVSMVHAYKGEEYLINLIDTPGHVDFGGNVTRAMRAIDGTVVLICGVEGVMPQTETVVRQALRERVKPVLFINKVDRLVKELKLNPEQISQRILALVTQFNTMVENISEAQYREKWKVNVQDGSVAFGSARENWALSFPYMQKKGIKFSDILMIYEMEEEQRKEWVWANAPLHEVVLDMVIKHLPDPVTAQIYRIPKMWHGDPESQLGKDLLTCNPQGKIAFVITRIVIDPKSGKDISAGRLFSGTIRMGTEVYLNNAKLKQRVQNVYIYNGVKPELIESLPAGNVLAISGVTGFAGETVTVEQEEPFEELKHIFEPVITKAIEPKKPGDLPKLIEVLRKVGREDPSIKVEINEETGQNLISGMGELHLEIIENRIITEKGVEVKTSPPIVVYRETITKPSLEVEGKTPNKHNKLYFKVEPLDPKIAEGLKSGKMPTGRYRRKDDLVITFLREECDWDAKRAGMVKAAYGGNLFLDATRGIVQINEIMEMVLEMFQDVMKAGPLAKEPCINVMVSLTDCTLHEDAIHRGPAQMYPAIREGIRGAMMQAGPVMYEPLQVMRIEIPHDYVGEISKLVSSKRGQLLEMNQEGNLTIVVAKLPVGELLGWSNDLRSATEGRGNSSLMDQMFEKLPYELQEKVRQLIIQRKGLTAGELSI